MKIVITFILILISSSESIIGMDKSTVFEQYRESLRLLHISIAESRSQFNDLAKQLKTDRYGSLEPFERQRNDLISKGDTVYENYWNPIFPTSAQFILHPATNRFLQILECNALEQKEREEENERLAQQIKSLNLYLYRHLAAIHQSLTTVQNHIAHTLQIVDHAKASLTDKTIE